MVNNAECIRNLKFVEWGKDRFKINIKPELIYLDNINNTKIEVYSFSGSNVDNDIEASFTIVFIGNYGMINKSKYIKLHEFSILDAIYFRGVNFKILEDKITVFPKYLDSLEKCNKCGSNEIYWNSPVSPQERFKDFIDEFELKCADCDNIMQIKNKNYDPDAVPF